MKLQSSSLTLAALGVIRLCRADLLPCGDAFYDPTQYVCYDNQHLCPIINGEPLSYCSGACYSTCMYSCVNNILTLLPSLDVSTPFTLTASNPNIPVNGKLVTASGSTWSIGGTTATYCPDQVPDCPPGNVTAMSYSFDTKNTAMNVEVPGGQLVYIGPYQNVQYTAPHSAYIPPGSVTTGFAAYQGGCFKSLYGSGYDWVACPPTASGGGGNNGAWNLVAKNATNAANLGACYGVNLRVNILGANTVAAWEYT